MANYYSSAASLRQCSIAFRRQQRCGRAILRRCRPPFRKASIHKLVRVKLRSKMAGNEDCFFDDDDDGDDEGDDSDICFSVSI